jgi:secondary thiamine-phosphate synthase enzyme
MKITLSPAADRRQAGATRSSGASKLMRQSLSELSVQTRGEGFTNITAAINAEIARSGLRTGLATCHAKHTSCSLTVNENADPRVLQDLATYMRALVPEEGVRPISGQGVLQRYAHDDEGPDDMPAHIRTALTTISLSLAFDHGRLLLGTWQAIYLWEHRAQSHPRRLVLHLLGE